VNLKKQSGKAYGSSPIVSFRWTGHYSSDLQTKK